MRRFLKTCAERLRRLVLRKRLFDQLLGLWETSSVVYMGCRLFIRLRRALAVSLALVLSGFAGAQSVQQPSVDRAATGTLFTAYESAPGTGVMQVSAFANTSRTPLDRQALVKVVNLNTEAVTWQTTEEGAKALVPNLPFGTYRLEVSAVGYVTSKQEVSLLDISRLKDVKVVLQKDPSAVQFEVEDGNMSPKARKEMKQAIAALKANNLRDAERHLQKTRQLAPTSGQLDFLFGYLYFQKQEYDQSVQYLEASLSKQSENASALLLLGRANLERKSYAAAQAPLEKVATLQPDAWLPHSLLADVHLYQGNNEGALAEANLAIEKGGNRATSARVVLGEALLHQGNDEAALRAFDQFLHDAPDNPLAPDVHKLVNEIRAEPPAQTVASTPASAMNAPDPLRAMPKTNIPIKPWQPTGIDEFKPTVAHDVSCPLDSVLANAGDRVAQLVGDIEKFAAVEDLFHQRLDKYGVPIRTETRKFNYVASIAEPEPGYLEVDEYREEKLTLEGYPDHLASSGFAMLAFVFHPHVQPDFTMQCEGLGDWQGQATWLVRFQQRPDRPSRMHSYRLGSQMRTVGLKGRAWIRADNFQILRIESELVAPVPEIELRSEHQVVEYAPVPFAKAGTSLWLPRSAELYLDFRRQRFYRRHSFDHYMLFSVAAEGHAKDPKPVEKPAQN
jgi:tetratricopeptide (TPR) repeat protein